MAPLNWDQLNNIEAETIAERIDYWYDQINQVNTEREANVEHLQALFNLTRTVLEIKASEAETATEEATKQVKEVTEEKAQMEEELNGEIRKLRQQINDLRKQMTSRDRSKDSPAALAEISALKDENGDLKKRIKQFEEAELSYIEDRRRSEELEAKMKEMELSIRDITADRDKYMADVNNYKRQLEMQRETITIKRGEDDDLQRKLRSKNQELLQLLDEVNNLTEANERLQKEKVKLKSSLEDSVQQMEKTTDKFVQLQKALQESDSALEVVQRENIELREQIEELSKTTGSPQRQQKSTLENEILSAVDKKIEEWKTLLESKDNELLSQRRKIQQLQNQINQYSIDSDRVNLMAMKQELDEKNESLKLLKSELQKATLDLEKNADLMEEFRVQLNAGGSITEVQKKRMINLQQRLKEKEAAAAQAELKAKEAEDAAVERDKQLVDLLSRMQRYEKGQYGLADAVDEINDLKHQMNIRDRQIEDLTQHCSKCEDKLNDLLDENEEMRKKLGLDKRQSFPIKFRQVKREERESDRALNIILHKEIERLEEERLQLKMQMRQLAQRTGQRAVALGLTADEVVAIEEFTEGLKGQKGRKPQKSNGKLSSNGDSTDQIDTKSAVDAVIVKDLNREAHQLKAENVKLNAENARLIQGLKEIQKHMKDSVGGGIVESPALDKLLSIISTRDVKGISDSNLTLKADFDQLRGRYEEIRSQLKSSREELQKSGVELISCRKQIQKLQLSVDQFEETKKLQVIHRQIRLPPDTSEEAARLIHQLNEHLIQELHENSLKEEQLGKLEESADKYQRKFAVLKHQQGLMYEEFAEQKRFWESQLARERNDHEEIKQKWSEAQTKLQEFDQLLDNLSTDEVELRRRLSELTRRYTATRITSESLTRQLMAQAEVERNLQEEKDKYEREALTVRTVIMERLAHLQRQKDMSAYQISALQKQLEQSCPLADYQQQGAKLLEVTEKYRHLLDMESLREIQLKERQDQVDEQEFLRKENNFLAVELETAKEKIVKLELRSSPTSANDNSTTESISKRIATLEMKELNERQKANHSVAMYEQQRDQMLRLERRNAELEQKFDQLTGMNLQLQQSEANLRDELSQSVPASVHSEDLRKISSLEKRLAEAKIESDQLKEMAEVTNSQFLYLDKKQREKTVEFEELQRLVQNLQSKSDYSATVGTLHREIIRLKLTETSSEANLRIALSKLQNLRTQLLKSEQRSDEKEKSLQNLRAEMVHKIAQLRKTISSLRSRFAGSVPLRDQEAFAEVLRELKAEKTQIHQQLLDTSEREKEAKLKVAELSLKQASLEELLATVKEGNGALKVAEWHGKMEELRLKELRLARQLDRLVEQNRNKDELISKLENSISSMELRSVEETKAWEEREIVWETRESELESRFQVMEKQHVWKDKEMLRFEVPGLMNDGTTMSLTEQLAEALAGLRKYLEMVNDLQQENEALTQKVADAESVAKKFEVEQMKTDQLVKDLKNLIPAETLANLSLNPTETNPIGYDRAEDMRKAKEFLMITVDSLNARLAQKDDAMNSYKQLLASMETEISQLHQDYNAEISKLKDQLRDKTEEKIAQLRQESSQVMERSAEASQLEKFLLRNVELEELIAERDNSAAAMVEQMRSISDELRKSRDQVSSLEAELRRLKTGGSKQPSIVTSPKSTKRKPVTPVVKTPSIHESPKHIGTPIPLEATHEVKPDTARTEGLTDIDESMDEDNISGAKGEIHQTSSVPSPIRPVTNNTDETYTAGGGKTQRSAEQLALKTSLDRLKRQLATKDKENKALNRALVELKTEMLSLASRQPEKTSTDQSGAKESENRDSKLKIEELENKLAKLRREVKRMKDFEDENTSEIQELRAEITRKDSAITRLKSDKLKLEKEVENAESRMSHLRESIKLKLHETETKDLRKKIATLEENLQSMRHTTAEKPLDTKEGRSQEVARWEENKKLQQQMEKLKERLAAKTKETDDKQKQINRLNEAVSRLEREKFSLETELKTSSKRATTVEELASPPKPSQKANVERPSSALRENLRILQEQNRRLTEELAEMRVRKDSNANEEEDSREQLKLDNSYLHEKCEILETRLKALTEERRQDNNNMESSEKHQSEFSQEHHVSSGTQEYLQISPKFPECAISKRFNPEGKSSEDLFSMVLVLKKTVDMLYEENRVIREKSNTDVIVRLRNQVAQLRENLAKLEEENEELREDMEEQPRVGNIGTINRLHEAVDQLESEKRSLMEELEQLKFRQQNGPDQSDVEKILKENRDLKDKLRRNQPRVAWAEQLTTDSSRTAASKLATENEKLRKDLKKEQNECERLKKNLREMTVINEKLQEDLVKFQSIAANKRKWQPNGVGRLYEHKNKELDEDLKRLTSKTKQLEDTLKQEIQKYHKEALECRKMKEKVTALEWKPTKDTSQDETTKVIRDLKVRIADLTADNQSLKTDLEIVERQLKPAWIGNGEMDMNVVKERLKLYDKLLQESVELKLECNHLRSQLNINK